jgi:branched-chain amino acid transport system permease protein
LFLERLICSPYGRQLRAIREDEIAARSLGKNPGAIRLTAFITGSCILGLAGGLYATFYAFVSPRRHFWHLSDLGGLDRKRLEPRTLCPS